MKDKNRFSILLEHLMAIAELKNSILAKAVQYDDSYISKWISGKLLPTEKNHENTLQAISHCIVEALSEESTAQLYTLFFSRLIFLSMIYLSDFVFE